MRDRLAAVCLGFRRRRRSLGLVSVTTQGQSEQWKGPILQCTIVLGFIGHFRVVFSRMIQELNLRHLLK